MTDYDIGPISGVIYGGLGLGITAGVAMGVMNMVSDQLRYQREREHYHTRRVARPRPQARRSSGFYFDPYGGSRY